MASNQGNQGQAGGPNGQQRGGDMSSREQTRDDQGQFAEKTGSQGGQSSGSSDRGFSGMDDQQRRDAARRGGETSSQEQERDDQGQFSGTDRDRTSGQGSSKQRGNQGGSKGSTNR